MNSAKNRSVQIFVLILCLGLALLSVGLLSACQKEDLRQEVIIEVIDPATGTPLEQGGTLTTVYTGEAEIPEIKLKLKKTGAYLTDEDFWSGDWKTHITLLLKDAENGGYASKRYWEASWATSVGNHEMGLRFNEDRRTVNSTNDVQYHPDVFYFNLCIEEAPLPPEPTWLPLGVEEEGELRKGEAVFRVRPEFSGKYVLRLTGGTLEKVTLRTATYNEAIGGVETEETEIPFAEKNGQYEMTLTKLKEYAQDYMLTVTSSENAERVAATLVPADVEAEMTVAAGETHVFGFNGLLGMRTLTVDNPNVKIYSLRDAAFERFGMEVGYNAFLTRASNVDVFMQTGKYYVAVQNDGEQTESFSFNQSEIIDRTLPEGEFTVNKNYTFFKLVLEEGETVIRADFEGGYTWRLLKEDGTGRLSSAGSAWHLFYAAAGEVVWLGICAYDFAHQGAVTAMGTVTVENLGESEYRWEIDGVSYKGTSQEAYIEVGRIHSVVLYIEGVPVTNLKITSPNNMEDYYYLENNILLVYDEYLEDMNRPILIEADLGLAWQHVATRIWINVIPRG